MDRKQMEMLSVKSAIERMVQNYISAYSTTGSYKEFFTAVERLVASFFVSGQIESNYLVRSTTKGDLEVRFTACKHCTGLTFLLPEQLRWRVDVVKRETAFEPFTVSICETQPDALILESTIRVNPAGHLEIYKNGKWVQLPNGHHTSPQVEQEQPAPTVEETFDPFEAYDRAKKAVRNMG
jgi:hypothetical protein